MKFHFLAIAVAGMALLAGPAFPQAPAPAAPQPGPRPAYGPPISMAQAKKVAAAAEAESRKLGIDQAIAVVDPSGELVYFERMDGSSYAHILLAQRKAQTAARFKAPSQAFQDRVQTNNFLLGLEGALPIGGGVPIVLDGKIIGAIGVAGALVSPPDEQVAKAGAEGLK